MDIIKSLGNLCTSSKFFWLVGRVFGGCFLGFVFIYAFPFPPAIADTDLFYLEQLCLCLLRSLAAVASPKSLQMVPPQTE